MDTKLLSYTLLEVVYKKQIFVNLFGRFNCHLCTLEIGLPLYLYTIQISFHIPSILEPICTHCFSDSCIYMLSFLIAYLDEFVIEPQNWGNIAKDYYNMHRCMSKYLHLYIESICIKKSYILSAFGEWLKYTTMLNISRVCLKNMVGPLLE